MSDLESSVRASSKEPCVCWQLHVQCDPATYSEATNSLAKERGHEHDKQLIQSNELVDATDSRCPTCQTIRVGIDAFRARLPKDDYLELEEDTRWVVVKDHVRLTRYICLRQGDFELIQSLPNGQCLSRQKEYFS